MLYIDVKQQKRVLNPSHPTNRRVPVISTNLPIRCRNNPNRRCLYILNLKSKFCRCILRYNRINGPIIGSKKTDVSAFGWVCASERLWSRSLFGLPSQKWVFIVLRKLLFIWERMCSMRRSLRIMRRVWLQTVCWRLYDRWRWMCGSGYVVFVECSPHFRNHRDRFGQRGFRLHYMAEKENDDDS